MSSSQEKSPSEHSAYQQNSKEPSANVKVVAYDWQKRWLKGHEYHNMLANMERYCQKFGFKKYQAKDHPREIYYAPNNGLIYFVKGRGVGQEFGFPRVGETKKRYRWKKMNFTTDLPKKNPQVTYVVASIIRAHCMELSESPEFKMHAVIPYSQVHNSSDRNEYILCHVRALDQKLEIKDCSYRTCFFEEGIDFYRLFAFLHNLASTCQL